MFSGMLRACQAGPQLGLHDADRRLSLGWLCAWKFRQLFGQLMTVFNWNIMWTNQVTPPNRTEIRLYLPFFDDLLFQINRCIVNTIWFRFDFNNISLCVRTNKGCYICTEKNCAKVARLNEVIKCSLQSEALLYTDNCAVLMKHSASKTRSNRVYRLLVRCSFVFASSNCD